MKLYNTITIVFLASLILFMPLARSAEEYELSTLEEKTILINVQNTKIFVKANLPAEIEITVFYLDPVKNNLTEVLPTTTFTENIKIDAEKKGFYQLQFLSTESIVSITISTNTMPNTSIIIILFTLILMTIFRIRKQFSRSFAY